MDIKKIDIEELAWAFEDNDVEHRYYLDLETGRVEFISDVDKIPEMEELDKRIEEGLGERYIAIPDIPSYEAYEDMRDFIDTIEDEELKEKLYIAIDGKGAFRRFKNVLLDYPEERERWFEFNDARVMERVKEWLEEEGIGTDEAGEEIEIQEIDINKIGNLEIEEEWKGFGPRACLNCGSEEGFTTRYFVLSRCPEREGEEKWLEKTMKERFEVEHFGIIAGALGNDRALLDAARCKKCGSWDVFFDF